MPASTAPLVFLVDELADYVGPSFRQAPASWLWLVRRGRKYGATVIAASQRPEEIDKTLFSMANVLDVHAIGDPNTQLRLARALGVPRQEVEQLQGHAWIRRNRFTGALIRG